MYFRGWIHSWTCGDCLDADRYWRLRAFYAGVRGDRSACCPPKRCPSGRLWMAMWMDGYDSVEDVLEF